MFPAKCRRIDGLEIEARYLGAGVTQAALADDINHAVLSMSLAIHRRIDGLEIKARYLGAGVTRAALADDINHAVLSMSLAIRRRLAAI